MFATDFLFNRNQASDFDLIIGSFDSEVETATGGEIEFNTVKTPNRNTFDFYDAKFNTILTWNFSVIKNPYTHNHDDLYFDQYEESQIAKWLLRTDGYKWFRFLQEGYEDIFYRVQVNMKPHQVWGKTVGFDLEVKSNCGYGFTEKKIRRYTLNSNNPIKLNINCDILDYILPCVSVTGSGDFYISNDSDILQNKSIDQSTQLFNVSNIVVMDSDTDQITGVLPQNFNWYFLRLVDGVNVITTDSENDISVEIVYREPRRVIV